MLCFFSLKYLSQLPDASRSRNLFDLLLVVMSLIDFMVFRLFNGGAGFTEVKLLKTLRIMRVFRVFRFFRQLTQLALMITAARHNGGAA